MRVNIALIRFLLCLRHLMWRWKFRRLILKSRGLSHDLRAVFLSLATGKPVAFVHDALFNESNDCHRTFKSV